MSIPFLLDEKPTVVRGGCGESGREAREVFQIAAPSNSERAAPSACVGKRFSALRLSGVNRLPAPGRAAGRGSAGPDE